MKELPHIGSFPVRRRGTTLMEVALMMVIIGVAIAAMMQFLTSATSANRTLADQPIGITIARAGHEWARAQDPAQLLTHFAIDASIPGGYTTFNPTNPSILEIRSTTALPRALASTTDVQSVYSDWSQRFSIRRVLIDQPTSTDTTRTSKALELTVAASKRGQTVCSLRRLYYLD